MLIQLRFLILLLLGTSWMFDLADSDRKDFNTCTFFYWKMDWHSAVRTCMRYNKRLMCYKSKKEMDDITAAFNLAAGNAELEIWLSSKNCSELYKMEECLSLHITKSSEKVWHYFQEDCSDHFPFVCCVNDEDWPTTKPRISTTDEFTTLPESSSPSSTTDFSSTATPDFCEGKQRRRIGWPITPIGEKAVQPCPGKSTGDASWFCGIDGMWSESGPDMKDCRSLQLQDLREKFNESSIANNLLLLNKIFEDKDQEIFGEDLAEAISMMTLLPDRFFQANRGSPEKWAATKEMVEKSASIFDRMLDLSDSWQDIAERLSSVGSKLLFTVDQMGLLLADSMAENIDEQNLVEKNFALQVMRAKYGDPLKLPRWSVSGNQSYGGNIILEQGYDARLNPQQGNISVVFTLYNDMTAILSPQPSKNTSSAAKPHLNSAVVSATVGQNRNSVAISKKVKILVEHLVPQPNNTACVFWNLERNQWDRSGCQLESSNQTYSLCACDHLTNFAVLMDFQGVMDEVDQLPFFFITVIGCALSIICLSICVAIFSCYSYHSRHSWGLRYVIHRNLCLTLLIANLVLVLGFNKTENPKICAIVAGMLHYFFLSAFSWMLLEGVHIYLLLVVVFASRRSHWEKYYLFGYGFPLIVVTITAISRPMYYGTEKACWLSTEKDTIWAFMGPVACILVANTAALALAQWKASHISIKDDNAALFKRWLRVTIILFPVLGITWIVGFLFVGTHFEVAGYLFAIFNSLQGFCIFVCHCVMDKKARSMVMDSFKRKSATVTTGSSGGTGKKQNGFQESTDKTNSFSQNGPNLNKHSSSDKKPLTISFQQSCRRNWNKWHKPWSFCFDMPISEDGKQESKKELDEVQSKPVTVQWNNLGDK